MIIPLLSNTPNNKVIPFTANLQSIEKAFSEKGREEEDVVGTSLMIGIVLLASGAFKPAIEAFQMLKPLVPKEEEELLTPLIDALIDIATAILSSQNLDYVNAIDHLSTSKAKLKKLTEKAPEHIKKLMEFLMFTLEIIVATIIANRSDLLRDYNTVASKYEEICNIIKDSTPLTASLMGSPFAKYWNGQFFMTSGLGKIARSRYLANSGLIEESIQLCEQAKNDLSKAETEFIESEWPQSDDLRKKALQYIHVIIPSIISNFKNEMLLQSEVKKLKSEVTEYKHTIEKILNRPIESVIKVEQIVNQIQENTQTVQNISDGLRNSLKELLTEIQKTKDNKLESLEKEIESALQENNTGFLHKAKGLSEKLQGLVKIGQKVYPFIPLAVKIIDLLHFIP